MIVTLLPLRVLHVIAPRRDKLLADSRYWVAPEALEARIAAALDNPVPLGATD